MEDKLRLNQYVPVVKRGNRYLFGNSGFMSMEESEFITLNEDQANVLDELAAGRAMPEDKLSDVFGNDMVAGFKKSNILTDRDIDTDSIYSRSKAYYFFNKMGNVHDALRSRHVLILGCGGIGSHVAWNLAVMGVGHLTLLDFDVVEVSNLNRQLLYDLEDAGRPKVEALKEKLLKINPDVDIDTVEARIWSEEELERVVIQRPYDLIIKSVDSPARFPLWLDNVCRRHGLKYIAGITVSSNPLIGPTFIPGISAGYTDFFEESDEYNHVSGISLSIGIIMYHISSEISIEAFKVLSGKGKLKYLNCIHALDDMNNSVLKLTPKKPPRKFIETDNMPMNVLCMVIILIMSMLTLASSNFIYTWINLAFALISPYFIYRTGLKVIRSGFLNMLTLLVGNSFILLSGRSPIDISRYQLPILLISLFASMSLYVLIGLSLMSIVNYLLDKIRFSKRMIKGEKA